MEGIRVYSHLPFASLFAPIFDRTHGLDWIIPLEPFRIPDQWIGESEYDDVSEIFVSGPIYEFQRDVQLIENGERKSGLIHGYFASTDLLPKYAPTILAGNCAIFGLKKPVTDARTWLEMYYELRNRADYVKERAEIVFLNMDGSFWEFYARDEPLLHIVQQHLEAVEEIEITRNRLDGGTSL